MPVRYPSSAHAGIWPALVMLIGAVVAADVASAQPINGRGRWCATFPQGGTYDCAYHTLEQCMAAASGMSNQCSLNPWYVERPDPQPRSRDPRR